MSSNRLISKIPVVVDSTRVLNTYYPYTGGSRNYGTDQVEILFNQYLVQGHTPGWKTRLRRGQRTPINSFQGGALVKRDYGGSAIQVQGSRIGDTFVGSARAFFPVIWKHLGLNFGYNTTPLRNETELKALAKCANMALNISQSFAERRQTAQLLVNSINRVVVLARFLAFGNVRAANNWLFQQKKLFQDIQLPKRDIPQPKRFRKDSLRNPVRDFPSLWLEYQYGWRPLLNDVYGTAQLLADTFSKYRPLSVTARSVREVEFNEVFSEFNVIVDSHEKIKLKGKTTLRFDIRDYEADLLQATGLSNPALLAWELLPYSFVVDWIYPLGTYLKAVEASRGLQFVEGFTSILYKYHHEVRPRNGLYNFSAYDCQADGAILDRYKLTSFPEAKLPTVNWGIDLQKGITSIALLSQLFKSGKQVVK